MIDKLEKNNEKLKEESDKNYKLYREYYRKFNTNNCGRGC